MLEDFSPRTPFWLPLSYFLSFKIDSYSYKAWSDISGFWTWSTYIFRLKDMAYHLVLLLCLWCPGRSFNTVLGGCAWHPASRHQDHDVPDVCDVGYRTECVVHHRLLLAKSTKFSHVEDKINLWTSAHTFISTDEFKGIIRNVIKEACGCFPEGLLCLNRCFDLLWIFVLFLYILLQYLVLLYSCYLGQIAVVNMTIISMGDLSKMKTK